MKINPNNTFLIHNFLSSQITLSLNLSRDAVAARRQFQLNCKISQIFNFNLIQTSNNNIEILDL